MKKSKLLGFCRTMNSDRPAKILLKMTKRAELKNINLDFNKKEYEY